MNIIKSSLYLMLAIVIVPTVQAKTPYVNKEILARKDAIAVKNQFLHVATDKATTYGDEINWHIKPLRLVKTENVADAKFDEKAEIEKPKAPLWQIAKDTLLSEGLRQWSEAAGFKLVWHIDHDYRIENPIALNGGFVDVVNALCMAYAKMDDAVILIPKFYPKAQVLEVRLGQKK